MRNPLESQSNVATGNPVATLLGGWSSGVLRALLLSSVLVPLIFFSGFFFPYITTRALFFRGVVELATGIVAVGLLLQGRASRVGRDPLAIALFLFVLVSGISAVLSPSPLRSFYGNFERMVGVWGWLHWLIYYVLLRIAFDERDWTRFFQASSAVSVVVSVIGVYQWIIFGVPGARPRIPSTIGNAGILAGYLLLGVTISVLLAIRPGRWRPFYLAAAVLDAIVIELTQNRAAFFSLVLGAMAAAIVYSASRGVTFRRWVRYTILGLIVFLSGAVLFERIAPQTRIASALPGVLERAGGVGTGGSVSIRMMQWRTALKGARDHPVLGIGPENHQLLWSRYFDPRALHTEPVAVYDRTHNQFLEVLATTGILGFAAFIAFWVILILFLRRASRGGMLNPVEVAVMGGGQLAYAGYLFLWFPDVNSTPMWIALCAYLAFRCLSVPLLAADASGSASPLRRAGYSLAIGAILVTLYLHVAQPLKVARLLDMGLTPRLPLATGVHALEATFDATAPQKSYAVLVFGGYLASVSPRFQALRQFPDSAALLDRAFKKAVAGSYREVRRDPYNDRLLVEYARVLLVAAEYYHDPKFLRAALSATTRAVELSPNRMNTRVILGSVFASLGDYPRALAAVRSAIRIDPTLGETHYELAKTFLAAGETDSAAAALHRAEDLTYIGKPATYVGIAERLVARGQSEAAADIYYRYLTQVYGKGAWSIAGNQRPLLSPDVWLAARLAYLYAATGNLEGARSASRLFAALSPADRGLAARFELALRTNPLSALPSGTLAGCPTAEYAARERMWFVGCAPSPSTPASRL